MKLISGILLSLLACCSVSAVTIGPGLTLDYNALQSPAPVVKLNVVKAVVRLDEEAQVSPLFTSLMPAALGFDTMDLPLESADGLSAPKGQILNETEAGEGNSVADLLKTEEGERSVVSVIGMALPDRAMVADIARLTESMGLVAPNSNSSFPAAAVLSQALLQRS
jgi:hypothetical protein